MSTEPEPLSAEDALGLIDSAVEFSTPEIRAAFAHVRQTIDALNEHVNRLLSVPAARDREDAEVIIRQHEETIADLSERVDGLLSTSTCTKCGWHGVPKYDLGTGQLPKLRYWCGRDGCGYAIVDPPLQDEIRRREEQIADLQARALDEEAVVDLLQRQHDAYFTDYALEHREGCPFIIKGKAIIRDEIARRKGTP